jgi:hypothetical protein
MADDFDIGRIDDVIHGRVRLGIMAVLAGVDSADFNTLKAGCRPPTAICRFTCASWKTPASSRSNKRFEGRKPLTEASMTPEGRKAFVAYLDAMQGLVGKTVDRPRLEAAMTGRIHRFDALDNFRDYGDYAAVGGPPHRAGAPVPLGAPGAGQRRRSGTAGCAGHRDHRRPAPPLRAPRPALETPAGFDGRVIENRPGRRSARPRTSPS